MFITLTTSSLDFGWRLDTHKTLYGLGGPPREPRLLILGFACSRSFDEKQLSKLNLKLEKGSKLSRNTFFKIFVTLAFVLD